MGQVHSLRFTNDYAVIECYKCHISFCVPESLKRHRLDDGESFWCPNGHSQCYTEPNIKKLERQLAEKERLLNNSREREESLRRSNTVVNRQLAAQKGVVTKIKKRVHNGVCPCCKRTFANLAAHMQNQHPDFVTKE